MRMRNIHRKNNLQVGGKMSKTYEEYIAKRSAMLTMDAVINMATALLEELKETKKILNLARTIEIE